MKGKFAAAISVLFFVLICLGIVGGILAIIFIPLRLNPAFKMGMELAQNDPAVIDLFGSPVEVGLLVMGTTKGNLDGSGSASLTSSISGPKAKGSIQVFGIENPKDVWKIMNVTIYIENKTVLRYSAQSPDEGFQP
jgi:hypothetical protein